MSGTQNHRAAPQNARSLAAQILLTAERSGSYSNLVLDHRLNTCQLSPADRSLTARLVYGVTERRLTLDRILDSLTDRRDIQPEVRAALRLGLYQMLYLDRIPDHAAVDESVRLVPKRASGFVNAVLRQFLRSGKRIPLPDRESDPVGYLSVLYSVPEPLVARLSEAYSEERAESLLEAFSRPAPLTLRVNTCRISREDLLQRLKGAGIEAIACRISPVGITLSGGSDGALTALPGFAEGLFFVQDEASQICTAALGALPGEIVADVCACPGSKSFGIALDMQDRGHVYSFDLHQNKLSLIRSGAERLGLTCIRAAARDARHADPALVGVCDRVLADVPCSGFGVIWKKPEIRFKHPAQSAALPGIQAEILEESARLVRPGGVLVYSTCTLLPEENEGQVSAFLSSHPDFSPEPFAVGSLNVPGGSVTLAPDTHGTDGFFVAKFRKTTG